MTSTLRRTVLSFTVGISTTLVVDVARAQSFGRQGDVSFSAERLMGLYIFDDGPSYTLFGFGAPTPGGHPYTNPRLGVDGFVIDHLSIGGSLAFWSVNPEGPGNGYTGVMVAPRVGYAIEFTRAFGFWPRGGFTYRSISDDDEFALTLEGLFYAAPAPHFAFIFGPVIDFGVAGDREETRSFGLLSAGILGWL